jgi:putative FmdB family regulatory protein
MPLYEYRCADCRHSFDRLRSMREGDQAPPCPACGSARVERQVSVFALRASGVPAARPATLGGGCACGGACACSSHN